ncbi:DNA-dependent protein kinase catalytic subunit [Acrasis kona]|uniref:DNA-dependent protein kinase catalytic subunit n=1 Tax=Acrasis kona TaxID=1008807 RepID=A0AAW2YXV2_9EUKA
MTSSVQALEQHLKDLHAVIYEEKKGSILNPTSIISDINDFCARLSKDEYSLASSLIFDEKEGLFAFVNKSLDSYASDKTMSLARKASFDFILNYIKQADSQIADYAVTIKKWSLNAFRRDESNVVKHAALQPIIRLIQQDYPQVTTQSFDIKNTFQILFREFSRGKPGAVVKGALLELLGIITEHFPGECHTQGNQLLEAYMDTLQTQSQKPNPEMQLIASSFKGLSYFLSQFGGSIEEGSDYIKPLYGYLCKALELVNATRHDASKCNIFDF